MNIDEYCASIQFEHGQMGRFIGRKGVNLKGYSSENKIVVRINRERVNIQTQNLLDLFSIIYLVLEEGNKRAHLGLSKVETLEWKYEGKGNFGPVIGCRGETKHDIEQFYNVKLTFDLIKFSCHVGGIDINAVTNALGGS